MPWLVQGNCNHCGNCCYKKPVGELWDEDMLDPTGTRCKFYEDEIDTGTKFGHCRVMKVNNPKQATDVSGNKITDEELVWYEENCPQYPAVHLNIQRWADGDWEPPNTCAYTITWVD